MKGGRSRGISYQQLLDGDSRPVPPVLRVESTRELPVARVPLDRYTSPAFHALEIEKIWKKTWQMACREEELAGVGDHVVYEVADLSFLIMRSAPDEIRAFHNACLHRGRQLRSEGGCIAEIRCPFHGWTWNLDGSLARVPCEWDFPHVEKNDYRLPEARVGTWGGFVFLNPDPGASPLREYLGELPKHFERWPLEDRSKQAHVAKVLPCNWKVAQEAFMEAYHVVATHPQLLPGIGDANSQYDAWDHFSRAITPNMTPSPHLESKPSQQQMLDSMLGPGLVQVPEGETARRTLADAARARLTPLVEKAHELSDAELVDSFYYTVFPNFHPWGAYNELVYRFRPWENDPDRCLMEVMHLAPWRGERPVPVPVHWLSDDEDWACAPELGFLGVVFNQDTANLGRVQRGLHAATHESTTLGLYQETKIRHFHTLLERYVNA